MMPAAPNPWNTRAAASSGSVSAKPQAREAIVNIASPPMYTRRYPAMSPRADSGSSETVTASWYALTTQIASPGVVRSSCVIEGRAIFAMMLAMTDAEMAIVIVSRAARRALFGRPSVSSCRSVIVVIAAT